MKIEPFGRRVVVRKDMDYGTDEVASTVQQGSREVIIYKPAVARDPNKQTVGTIESTGPECKWAQVGDRVLYVRHLGDASFVGDENLVLMHEEDVIGRLIED